MNAREIEEKLAAIRKSAFIRRRLLGLLRECREESLRSEDFEISTIQNEESGAATVVFRFDCGTEFLGKLYPDESGAHALEVLTALWENGFAPPCKHRVPEPLFFVDEYKLLLTGKTPGETLEARLTQGEGAAMHGVKEAAQWLLGLHGSPVRIGHSNRLWAMFRELSERLILAAASRPGEVGRLVDMLVRLSEAGEEPGPLEENQVHGQFRPTHVFLGDDVICVAGFERSQPSDPAHDLAEFVQWLRKRLCRASGTLDLADVLTDAFLGEYAAAHPSGLRRLPFYRAFHALVSLCAEMEELNKEAPQWKRAIDFQFLEFSDAFSRGSESVELEEGPLKASVSVEGLEGGFGSLASALKEPEFVQKVVYPVVCGRSYDEAHPLPFETSTAQEDRGTGRVTVRYRFGADVLVFGKRYPSREPHAFEVMKELRGAGFGEGPYQAVEPLAFLADHNFLLTAAARGIPLVRFIGEQGPEVNESVRRAARWLVRLHRSPLRIGPQESFWKSMKLFSILRRLAKVAARMPHEREQLLEHIDRLYRKARERTERPPLVQTHGSFHYEHVYVTEETVTVIDFDQSFPSDPAKDLSFFLTMLRRRTFKRTGSLATALEATRAFVDEYRSHLPSNMQNLDLYWGAAILFDLFRYRKKVAKDESVRPLVAFLEEDYDAVLSGDLIGESKRIV